MRPLSLFDRARCFVGYYVVFGEADRYLLAEAMLADLGFDDLLLAMKVTRELKAARALVYPRQIVDGMHKIHRVPVDTAVRILADIRTGAVDALAPFSRDPLEALMNVNGDHDDSDYAALFMEWVKEPGAREKAIDLTCRSAAAKQLARELVLKQGLLVMLPDAWPQEYWGVDGDPIVLGLRPDYDGTEYDMVALRPLGAYPRRVLVSCDGRAARTPREDDVLVQLTAEEIASDPGGCADRVLDLIPPPSPRRKRG